MAGTEASESAYVVPIAPANGGVGIGSTEPASSAPAAITSPSTRLADIRRSTAALRRTAHTSRVSSGARNPGHSLAIGDPPVRPRRHSLVKSGCSDRQRVAAALGMP